jgi:DNA-binding transcriptional LysR family regulator
MLQVIAEAAALPPPPARGLVPSALTYRVRQIEDALDVLLFDRSSPPGRPPKPAPSCCARAPAAAEIDAVANRVRRVATGWEPQLTSRRPRTMPQASTASPWAGVAFVFAVAPHHPLATAGRTACAMTMLRQSPRRGRGRLGTARRRRDGRPAGRAGRVHRAQHAGQARGPAARAGLRLSAPSPWHARYVETGRLVAKPR